jgi:YHS domain-containing protein
LPVVRPVCPSRQFKYGRALEVGRWGNVVAKAKDPICGMTVDTDRAPAKGEYDGQPVYFCSADCKRVFESRRNLR